MEKIAILHIIISFHFFFSLIWKQLESMCRLWTLLPMDSTIVLLYWFLIFFLFFSYFLIFLLFFYFSNYYSHPSSHYFQSYFWSYFQFRFSSHFDFIFNAIDIIKKTLSPHLWKCFLPQNNFNVFVLMYLFYFSV